MGHDHHHEHHEHEHHSHDHHGHHHGPGHHHHHGTENLKLAFFLNLGFTLIEIAGGLLTNSVAILSDALHDLGDSLALGFAWAMEHLAGKKRDHRYSYGYRRFSLLAALINVLVLLSGSLLILTIALPRLWKPEAVHAPGMALLALLGIAVNGAAFFRLQRDSSMNSRVAALHLLEDVLGWVAVLIVSVVLLFVKLPILDPLLSIFLTLYILVGVFRNLKQTLELFLQSVPQGIELSEWEQRLATLEGVCACHHMHLWSLDGAHHVLSAHLVVRSDMETKDLRRIKQEAQALLEPLKLTHTTLELEFEDEPCLLREEAEREGTLVRKEEKPAPSQAAEER
jgi:cobalt-zinc-cadmium efflux system protein